MGNMTLPDEKEDKAHTTKRKFCEKWRFGAKGVGRGWPQYDAEAIYYFGQKKKAGGFFHLPVGESKS